MIASNIEIKNNTVFFAGQNTTALAQLYGTPLYLMDEDRIRENCRTYVNAFRKYFPDSSFPIFASKAASFKRIYQIIDSEGMGCDVVSSGEIHTAKAAGFSLKKAFFHSNNKTDFDIAFAMDNHIGYFVADGMDELSAINRIAGEKGKKQNVLIRLTPGIDTHTYEAVNTGKVDSKFGVAIETGQAAEVLAEALTLENVVVKGFHCHVGSQVFDSSTFIRSAEIMLGFIAEVKNRFGFVTEILNLGGGYGVRYTENDPVIDIEANIKGVAEEITSLCEKYSVSMPSIIMEPGRSIVADAGMTLYSVGSVKRITGYKNYVSVDGGMTDNPRFALYGSRYTVLCANKAEEKTELSASVVGRCCESGDIIQENVLLPDSICRGDNIAVCTTGAYNYSMASNYNRVPRPPIVMLSKGDSYVAVRRESFDDIIKNDM